MYIRVQQSFDLLWGHSQHARPASVRCQFLGRSSEDTAARAAAMAPVARTSPVWRLDHVVLFDEFAFRATCWGQEKKRKNILDFADKRRKASWTSGMKAFAWFSSDITYAWVLFVKLRWLLSCRRKHSGTACFLASQKSQYTWKCTSRVKIILAKCTKRHATRQYTIGMLLSSSLWDYYNVDFVCCWFYYQNQAL